MRKLLDGGVNNMESVKRKLFNKLKEFHPDKDFVLGVISNVDNDENYQHIIDFIEKGEDVTVENILALSILLDDITQKPRSEKSTVQNLRGAFLCPEQCKRRKRQIGRRIESCIKMCHNIRVTHRDSL